MLNKGHPRDLSHILLTDKVLLPTRPLATMSPKNFSCSSKVTA